MTKIEFLCVPICSNAPIALQTSNIHSNKSSCQAHSLHTNHSWKISCDKPPQMACPPGPTRCPVRDSTQHQAPTDRGSTPSCPRAASRPPRRRVPCRSLPLQRPQPPACTRRLSSVRNAHQELCAGQGQTFGSDPWTELIPVFSQRSKLDGFAALRAPCLHIYVRGCPKSNFLPKVSRTAQNCGNPCNSIHAMKPSQPCSSHVLNMAHVPMTALKESIGPIWQVAAL